MKKYLRSFLLGIQNAMEYRANFLLSMVSAAFPIFIQYFLWTAIYRGDADQAISGFTYAQMIAYTFMASITSRLIRTGFEYEINDDIKNGGLNKFIVKPIDYFSYRMSCFVGQKLMQTVFLAVIIAGVLIGLHLRFGLVYETSRILLFCLSLSLAFLLNFMIFYAVGMIAFWLFEIGFLYEAVRIVIIALSGGIFPLEIFGKTAVGVLSYLPFKYTINFPVELLIGRMNEAAVSQGIIVQVLWVAVLTFLCKGLWKVGSKRYVAVGG